MTTTEWFMGLSREERKAVLCRLHELRAEGTLDTYGYGSATKGLMLALLHALEDDHEAAKRR